MRRSVALIPLILTALTGCGAGTVTAVAQRSPAPSASAPAGPGSETRPSAPPSTTGPAPTERPTGDSTTSRAPSSSPAAAPGTTITTASTSYGETLFDDAGQAIYLFDAESTSEPECYGDCADDWPPVLTDGTPEASGGAADELLDTTTRTDGSVQVTYAGHPLYYYAHEDPHEVTCHDVQEYGGTWLVVLDTGRAAD